MTSTSFNVGINTASRNSSKVLKPPGGGSSDIFGAAAEPVEPQRKVKSHLTSSIFNEDSATPSRNKAGNSSFYNLFGSEPQNTPLTDSSNKPNITTDNNEESTTVTASTENSCLVERNGNELTSGDTDDTPSPNEAPVMNGNTSSTTSAASSAAPTPTNTAPAAGRPRIPPGGFSSGLW